MNRIMPLLVAGLGLVALVLGVVFVFQGATKNNLIVERMKVEKVALAIDPANPQQLTQIQNGADAQMAADVIAGHRRAISPSYQDLLGSGRFDPANPQHLTYAQAMNLENYLYLAVTAFGLIQVVLATGVFMIITGLAFGLIGLLLFKNQVKGGLKT
jgi:hypothetical protein